MGRHLVEHLVASGDDVATLDRHGDVSVDVTDPQAVDAAVEDARPEVVYHLAGWADVGRSWSEPMAVLKVNAEGTLNVLEAARRHGAERVVAVASADVYGVVTEAELPLTETSELRPTSPYAASKVAADYLALQAFLGHGQSVIRVRPFNHLGPGQSEAFVASALATRIARAEREGQPDIAVGNLSARRDFTDVRDIVRAYRLLVEKGVPGEAYNICSGVVVSIQEIADQLVSLARSPIALKEDPALLRPVDLPVLRGDASKLRSATGWEPQIPLSQTLNDILDDVRRRIA